MKSLSLFNRECQLNFDSLFIVVQNGKKEAAARGSARGRRPEAAGSERKHAGLRSDAEGSRGEAGRSRRESQPDAGGSRQGSRKGASQR